MSVREALDALLATHTGEVMTHDGRFVADCDPDRLADLIDAIAALREQAGVEDVAKVIAREREANVLRNVSRATKDENVARAVLRALGLEDA